MRYSRSSTRRELAEKIFTSYLAPRNLPSAGFLPFLQTVLCSSDATCRSTPYAPEDLLAKLSHILPARRKQRRSANLEKDSNPSTQSADAPESRNGSLVTADWTDSAANPNNTAENISSMASHASIQLLNKILKLAEVQKSSAANLKAEICEVMSANASPQSPFWEVIGANIHQTFCFSNLSLVGSFFQELRNQIPKLQHDPHYQMSFVKDTVSFLSLVSQVQNDTSTWRLLLMAPDIIQGVTSMEGMAAALQNTSRKVFSPDFAGEDLAGEVSHLSKNLKIIKKSLQLFQDLQEKFSTAELKNLELFKQYENRTILRLAEILSQQAAGDRDNTSRDGLNKEEIHSLRSFLSLLLQKGSSGLSLLDIMAHLIATPNVSNLGRSVWDPAFLNKINFNTTKTWQIMEMITHRFLYTHEGFRSHSKVATPEGFQGLQEVPKPL
ncbi:glucosylceramide transporter ABCA12-like [Varanus komodoensis]|uniref:glucosylceramide transporter ABCA12-like n=1 Tax=Varanus komodoensis TaxID=61221 RepID=UPI001CF792FC|nr:glucosylceramide transporter ABCA12-like [Varanus komodoensis]